MNSTLWRSRAARLVALAMVVALFPLPALAGDPGQAVGKAGIRASAAAIAKTERLAASQSGAQAPDKGSPSFFKRPVGIAILATFAVGVGYALYSTQHDRITSPAKQ